MLNEQELDYFQNLIKEVYGISLPRGQVQDQISRLVQLFGMVQDFKQQSDMKDPHLQNIKKSLKKV